MKKLLSITAEEMAKYSTRAKRLTEERNEELLKTIEEKIRARALNGRNDICFDVDNLPDEVATELKKNGFKVLVFETIKNEKNYDTVVIMW